MISKPLRVAMAVSQAPPVYGGAGGQALALARALSESGHEVDVFTQNQLLAPRREGRHPTIHRAPAERLARRLGRRGAEIARTFVFSVWLSARLLTRRYDLLHSHGNYWFTTAMALVSRLQRRPLVVKVTRLGEDDALTARRKHLGPLPVGRLYALGLKQASAVITLSAEIGARQAQVFPQTRAVAIPNGVDLARFRFSAAERERARKALDVREDALVVLFVGYLAPHKGVADVLAAWRGFCATREGDSPLLLVVGPREGFYRELSDRRATLAVDSTVIFTGHVQQDRMPALYSAADVFLLPTRAEGMPNSLLEALASGLPSIVSRVPGVIEIAERTHEVRLLDAWDPGTLVAALDEAVGRIGNREPTLPQEFWLGTVANSYAALYSELTGRTEPR